MVFFLFFLYITTLSGTFSGIFGARYLLGLVIYAGKGLRFSLLRGVFVCAGDASGFWSANVAGEKLTMVYEGNHRIHNLPSTQHVHFT